MHEAGRHGYRDHIEEEPEQIASENDLSDLASREAGLPRLKMQPERKKKASPLFADPICIRRRRHHGMTRGTLTRSAAHGGNANLSKQEGNGPIDLRHQGQ